MLQELSIQNFAIIDHLNINFANGMTVLTGETGAGKSIIIDALGLLAGERAFSEYIRKDAEKAVVQGFFQIDDQPRTIQIMENLGLAVQADGLLLQRELYRTGKNICRVNGQLVNLAMLRELGQSLIEIHSQHKTQMLLRKENHLSLLDSYDASLLALKEQYRQLYQTYRTLKQQVEQRQADEQAWMQRQDMLEFQAEEIGNAQLVVGEEAALEQEKRQLDNFQVLNGALNESYQLLSGDGSHLMSDLSALMSLLNKTSDLSAPLQPIADKVAEAYYLLEDASYEISNEASNLFYDEERLQEISDRLALISQLKRKYGTSIAEINAYYEQIVKELTKMRASGTDLDQQTAQVEQAYQAALTVAKQLSAKREAVGKELAAQVEAELKALYMKEATFAVKQTPKALGPTGIDDLEFYLQTNVGEELAPLVKIASGGELSRVMLALKTIFAKQQAIKTIIFDEADTGVSGRVAQAMGEKMIEIAGHAQVLCITHLPQVAALASEHYYIVKQATDGRTATTVNKLASAQRVTELARMIAGAEVTELTLEHAKELLALAQQH